MYKVVIPSAGLGTRVGTHIKAYNKAVYEKENDEEYDECR